MKQLWTRFRSLRWWWQALIALVLVAIVTAPFQNTESDTDEVKLAAESATTVPPTTEAPVPTEPTEAPVTEPPVTEPPVTEPPVTEPPTTAAPEPSETPSQRNARRRAESYLDFMGFSRKGLIEQLEFEGFPTADAEWAVDHVDVDWNAQAAKKAESYLEMMGFSRSGLIEQLMFEGFTREQAEFGASSQGL